MVTGAKRMHEALEWAIAEIEGLTRYDNDDQFSNALGLAKGALASFSQPVNLAQESHNRPSVSYDELKQWAGMRADDAGHLARELIVHRDYWRKNR